MKRYALTLVLALAASGFAHATVMILNIEDPATKKPEPAPTVVPAAQVSEEPYDPLADLELKKEAVAILLGLRTQKPLCLVLRSSQD